MHVIQKQRCFFKIILHNLILQPLNFNSHRKTESKINPYIIILFQSHHQSGVGTSSIGGAMVVGGSYAS